MTSKRYVFRPTYVMGAAIIISRLQEKCTASNRIPSHKQKSLSNYYTTQTHKRLTRKPIIRTKDNMRIFRVIPFNKLQNDTKATVKRWKMRCRTGNLTCFWMSYVVVVVVVCFFLSLFFFFFFFFLMGGRVGFLFYLFVCFCF